MTAPLISLRDAGRILGLGRTALWARIEKGQLPVVYTAPRKRWVPARVLMPHVWEGGSLTRRELAGVLDIGYAAIVRAVTAGYIPVDDAGRIPAEWIAAHCDPQAYGAQAQVSTI